MTGILLALLMAQLPVDHPYRGIYLSAYRAASTAYLDRVVARAGQGLINTVVIDVKTDFGFVAFPCRVPLAAAAGATTHLLELERLVPRLKAAGLHLVARLVVFKDPYLAKLGGYGVRHARTGELWLDAAGNAWVSPFDERVWDYNIAIAREAVAAGFDEVQFDYVRFPTDGDVGNCVFPHAGRSSRGGNGRYDAIAGFLARARRAIGVPVAVDVYGYAAWRVLVTEGQDLKRIGPDVDYACPMLYPSHFSSRFLREFNDTWRSYWIYYESVRSAQRLLDGSGCRVVPYVQAFNYRSPEYGPDYIYVQMRAALDAGSPGFLLWHAAGDYETAYQALRWIPKRDDRFKGLRQPAW